MATLGVRNASSLLFSLSALLLTTNCIGVPSFGQPPAAPVRPPIVVLELLVDGRTHGTARVASGDTITVTRIGGATVGLVPTLRNDTLDFAVVEISSDRSGGAGANRVVEGAEPVDGLTELRRGDGLRSRGFLRGGCAGPNTKDTEDTEDETGTDSPLCPSCPL